MNEQRRRVALVRQSGDIQGAVEEAAAASGILERVRTGSRVAIKPNLTYPYYKAGVTTSPVVLRALVRALRERGAQVAVVESDGGYGAWSADQAFAGHGLTSLPAELGVELVNLCQEPREPVEFRAHGRRWSLPLPTRLLHETDLLISMPVPKVHCMTRLTLAFKNQWGCVPDPMRLRKHHLFNEAILAIDRALRPAVLADGTWFLDRNGPMEGGDPIRMDLVIGASDAGSFDRYVSELMGISWRTVPHLRLAARLGALPRALDDIDMNVAPALARTRTFRLERTSRNYIALAGFRSRFLTWLGYESWFGRVVLHALLYAVAGKPVQPLAAAPEPALHHPRGD